MRIKNAMNYDQNDCPTVFFHNPSFFLTLAETLKTKVGDVVGCIFEVECTYCWWIFDFETDFSNLFKEFVCKLGFFGTSAKKSLIYTRTS
jgi:hypothetical protein